MYNTYTINIIKEALQNNSNTWLQIIVWPWLAQSIFVFEMLLKALIISNKLTIQSQQIDNPKPKNNFRTKSLEILRSQIDYKILSLKIYKVQFW